MKCGNFQCGPFYCGRADSDDGQHEMDDRRVTPTNEQPAATPRLPSAAQLRVRHRPLWGSIDNSPSPGTSKSKVLQGSSRSVPLFNKAMQCLLADEIAHTTIRLEESKQDKEILEAAARYERAGKRLQLARMTDESDSAGTTPATGSTVNEADLTAADRSYLARYRKMSVEMRTRQKESLASGCEDDGKLLAAKLGEREVDLSFYSQNDITMESETKRFNELKSSLASLKTLQALHGEDGAGDGTSAASNQADNLPENIEALAKFIYTTQRYYQGTTSVEAEDRRNNGMDPAKKKHSSINNAISSGLWKDLPDTEVQALKSSALSHFYFTKLKRRMPDDRSLDAHLTAEYYAKLASNPGDEPKLLRTLLPKKAAKLELDPDSGPGAHQAWRTQEKVAAGYVLRSKKAPVSVTAASESFRDSFNTDMRKRALLRIDTEISSEEAARMLREQQTDSETDFSDNAPWKE